MTQVAISEKQFVTQILDLLAATGWRLRYHTYRSRRSPSGFPDEVWVRERVVFAELKSDRGELRSAQRAWLQGLLAAGAEAYLLYPTDLVQLARVLQTRGRPAGGELERRTQERLA